MDAIVFFALTLLVFFFIREVINNRPISPIRFYRVIRLWFITIRLKELHREWDIEVAEMRLHYRDVHDGVELQAKLDALNEVNEKANRLIQAKLDKITGMVALASEEKQNIP